jgi:hypothetical protein
VDVISLDNQIACVRRELSLRRAVYPRLIVSHKMTQQWADFQMDAMESVLRTLEALKDAEAHAEQAELFPAPGKEPYATPEHQA